MRKAFLKKARETLEDMRSQLLRSVKQDLSAVRDQNKDEGMDTYDLASDARDKEINLILGDRDREKVQAIDEALSRIETEQLWRLRELRERHRRGAAPGAALHPPVRELPGGSGARAQDAPPGRG